MNAINKLNRKEIFKSPFILFSPFLILSIVIVILFDDRCIVSDEVRYVTFAQNLLHGFYSLPAPNIYLGAGPGYPFVLVPFVALKLPLICYSLLNSILYYFSIILLYNTIIQIASKRGALVVSLFWASYINSYEHFAYVTPEIISSFLVSLLLYFLIKSFLYKDNINRYIYFAGFTLGYLALSKIIFGYVLLVMLVGSGLLILTSRSSSNYRKCLAILLVAFLTTLPYLFYTYHLTGKAFYWGSNGGSNMYWMSTPFRGEYGSWFIEPKLESDSVFIEKSSNDFRYEEFIEIQSQIEHVPGTTDYIKFNHQKDFEKIYKLSDNIEQDSLYKRFIIDNIKSHPIKYIENIISNLGRILFNFPFTYKLQTPRTLLRLPFNGILLVLLLFCIFPTILNWKKILFPIRFSIFILCLYMGGSILGSAETRMFTVVVPIILIWISFILPKIIKINWKFN